MGHSLSPLVATLYLSKVILESLITSITSLFCGSSDSLRDSALMLWMIALGMHFLQTPPYTRNSSGCCWQRLENFILLRHPLWQNLMVPGVTTTMHLSHTDTYSIKKIIQKISLIISCEKTKCSYCFI